MTSRSRKERPRPPAADRVGTGEEDGFEDRGLRLGVTFGGAGTLAGDLTAGCAAALRVVLDALGKHLGTEDHRTVEQRQHDALAEALHRG